MPTRSERFYNNPLYKLLTNQTLDPNELLEQLNALLHEQPDLVEFTHPKEGSYYHVICQKPSGQANMVYRMVYALSNAGADPNVIDSKGNTPLHTAIMGSTTDVGFDCIQALFRIGTDPRICNHDGKTASSCIRFKPQLVAFCKAYGKGIWHAVETSDIPETKRLMAGFTKVDCKHNSNKTLLDKARDFNCTSIIDALADWQVTTELLHSILAFDWQRAAIIYANEEDFLKPSASDSIHRLTAMRQYSKQLLEYCLDTRCSQPFEIFFGSLLTKFDVNVLCTDGLPFFFHCFEPFISKSVRANILLHSNMHAKSAKGETFLFHLMHLYSLNANVEYLNTFKSIIYHNPLLIAHRNEHERTVVEVIELSPSMEMYEKLCPFYEAIKHLLVLQLKNSLIIEQLILNGFGYNLIVFCRNQTLLMTKEVYKSLRSLKSKRGLATWISSFLQAVVANDLSKVQYILKLKANIYHGKDTFGRTCTHLAVLHRRCEILKFFVDKYPNTVNARDSMGRTSFHYACIINDRKCIEILEQVQAPQALDCLNLSPHDYRVSHQLRVEIHAEDFAKDESQRTSVAPTNFLTIVFYQNFKKAIESDAVSDIKLLNHDLMRMGFHLKDMKTISKLSDYIRGERYIPLLFLALEHRAIASIKYLIQSGLPITGQLHIVESQSRQYFQSKLFRRRQETLHCFDITQMIDALDDKSELKNAFKQDPLPMEIATDAVSVKTEHESNSNFKKLVKRQMAFRHFFKNNEQKQVADSQSCIVL